MGKHSMEVAEILRDLLTELTFEDRSVGVRAIPEQQIKIFKGIIMALEESADTYDPYFGDDKMCICGHTYYRHFDSYDNMETCGCKYCDCYEFMEKLYD